VETYSAMASDTADARALLDVAPDQYVTERARLAKQARADGDKEAATFYQSLKHPGVVLWAVLAAGSDPDAVMAVMAATEELGGVQAGGSDARSLSAATQTRRKVLETIVDKAVKALAKTESGAAKRRPEIRGLVDQLSRHPEVTDSWIDGTLREVPENDFGFGAFADVEVTPRAKAPESTRSTMTPKTGAPKETKAKQVGRSSRQADDVRDLAAERAARAEQTRQAKQDVTAAARELTAADRKLDLARAALRKAEKELRLAEEQRDAVESRHEKATARLEAIRSPAGTR
jgi:hypothetical protein